MSRKLLGSLLMIAATVSLTSAAIWQPLPQQLIPQPTVSAEDAALIAQMMFDEEEDCPDLTNPNAPPNRHFC